MSKISAAPGTFEVKIEMCRVAACLAVSSGHACNKMSPHTCPSVCLTTMSSLKCPFICCLSHLYLQLYDTRDSTFIPAHETDLVSEKSQLVTSFSCYCFCLCVFMSQLYLIMANIMTKWCIITSSICSIYSSIHLMTRGCLNQLSPNLPYPRLLKRMRLGNPSIKKWSNLGIQNKLPETHPP